MQSHHDGLIGEDLQKRPLECCKIHELSYERIRQYKHSPASLTVALALPSSSTGLGCARHPPLRYGLVII